MKNFDIINYNSNFCSIKDIDSDIDIRNSKWDGFFDLIENFNFIYFHGERCLGYNKDLNGVIAKLFKTIEALADNFYILVQVDNCTLAAPRNDLSILWDSYEFSALIFSQEPLDEEVLRLEFRNKISFDRLLTEFPKILLFYRSFESDVLWIKKTNLLPSMTLLFPFLASVGANVNNK
jgi:hypothetical protein